MSQPFPANFGKGHFNAALVADHSAMLHALVLAAQAFPVCHGTENPRAEKTIPLRFKGAVINGFRLGDLSVRPGTNLLRRSQTQPDHVKFANQADSVVRAASKQFAPP